MTSRLVSQPGTLSHISKRGEARMVDVGNKPGASRTARAEAVVWLGRCLASRLRRTGAVARGPVPETARLAGIMAAKRTAELISLCHPIPLDIIDAKTTLKAETVRLESVVHCHHSTGVEMEAMTAAAVASLTVYDMCKAVGKDIHIKHVRLLEKTGGKSGD